MTAGAQYEFRMRHGEPASPERVADWVRTCLQAWRDGRCDGVVTYCLNLRPGNPFFTAVEKEFREFRVHGFPGAAAEPPQSGRSPTHKQRRPARPAQ